MGSLPETAAVAVNDPAVLFAVRSGELATPVAPVVAVAWAPPPVKVAPALEEVVVPHALEAAGAERERDRGARDRVAAGVQHPDLQRLRDSGRMTLADLLFSGIATILAGMPAAVFVSENETEPYCELAVTV